MEKTRVTFPDPNLEGVIRKTIGKPKGAISTSDLEHLTVLNAPDRGISDLTGLEYCLNLKWLNLSANNISDISPLAGLSNLVYLDFWDNNIRDISVLANLTNLVELDLGGNNVSDFSVLPFEFDQDGAFIYRIGKLNTIG